MLTDQEVTQIREELDNCKKPLFLFDDDSDGFCSYLLLYRYKKEGRGIIVKSAPVVDKRFVRKVEEYEPDKVFILDMPMVDQDFLDALKVPVVWIDHHEPQQREKVKYFNPRKNNPDSYEPTTTMCYRVVQQDVWIGMAGSVADWHLPAFRDEFHKKYPDLLDKEVDRPDVALYDSRLGFLIRVISFNLKGRVTDVKKIMNAMTKIGEPYDIIDEKSADGRYVMKRFKKLNEEYMRIYNAAMEVCAKPGRIALFKYDSSDTSFTSDLSTELSYRFPQKVIMVCREKGGEMKCSLRSRDVQLPKLINECLSGLQGHGGGHEYACGLVVREEQFATFMDRFKAKIAG